MSVHCFVDLAWRLTVDYIGYYLILVVIIVVVALMTVYHIQIVHWLTPVATWLRDKSVVPTLDLTSPSR